MTAPMTTSSPPSAPSVNTAHAEILVPGPKVLLVGGTGTGKTHVLRTLLDAGLEVFGIFTEPGMEVLADTDPKRLHWHYIRPAAPEWQDMIDSATKINTLSFENLTKLTDINKRKYTEFVDLLKSLSNFTDDRTGQAFGPVDLWGRDDSDLWAPGTFEVAAEHKAEQTRRNTLRQQFNLTPENNFGLDRALFIDSLSGINIMAMNLMAGSKPVKSMADWGVAMDNLERLITKLTTDVPCTMVMTAHLEREQDELTGGVQLMASTLGKKLAPRIPRFFSDVIHCKREGSNFSWSTASINVDLKARNLPISDKLEPSFVPLVNAWKSRQRKI